MTPPTPDAEVLSPIADIEAEMERRIARVGEDAGGPDLPEPLADAMRYAALGGGKRLRPLLAWHMCAACGGAGTDSLPAGAALEFVHAFSLAHDDLPAMDDDDLRRGQPTLHIHAGEAMAILAGDALLSLAFETLVHGYPDARTAAAMIRELSAGTAGMIAGQVYDISPGLDPGLSPAERLARIHRCKTGALMRAACRMGAIAAGTTDHVIETAGRFGDAIGLMFQAVDDLIDVEQPAELVGKQTGKDHQAGKLTYPGVYGIDRTRGLIEQLRTEAADLAGRLTEQPETLERIASYLAARDR